MANTGWQWGMDRLLSATDLWEHSDDLGGGFGAGVGVRPSYIIGPTCYAQECLLGRHFIGQFFLLYSLRVGTLKGICPEGSPSLIHPKQCMC